MMYQTSKLAREIAKYLGIKNITVVWDILDELGYEAHELTEKEVMKWTLKVGKHLSF